MSPSFEAALRLAQRTPQNAWITLPLKGCAAAIYGIYVCGHPTAWGYKGVERGLLSGSTMKEGFGFIGRMMAGMTCCAYLCSAASRHYLRERAKVTFDLVDNRGKPVADNLRVKISWRHFRETARRSFAWRKLRPSPLRLR